MRTTIDLTSEQRGELLRLAAKRGLKGFSGLVQEAVDEYLRLQESKSRAIESALRLKGSLRGSAAHEFEERVKAIRDSWR